MPFAGYKNFDACLLEQVKKGHDQESARKICGKLQAEAEGKRTMAELEGQWLEVFKAGDYGDKGQYTEADLDRIVANYDPAVHEAPAVVGHPEADAPAYGWVEGLRRNVSTLEAKLRQVDPGFDDLVKNGRFKQRSVALYNDLGGKGLYLRHLGFLGAQPPEVKGLKSIFHDADAKGYVEIMEEIAMTKDEFKSWFSECLEAVGLGKKPDPAAKTFSEADLEAAKIKAAEEARTAVEKKFAENKAAADKATAETQRLAAAAATKKAGIHTFIENLKRQGKWLPAFEKAGLVQFMESLPDAASIEFGEGEAKKTESPLAIFEGFIENLPARIEFGERKPVEGAGAMGTGATNFNEPGREGVAVEGREMDQRIRAVVVESKKTRDKPLSYAEARDVVRGEMAKAN